MKIFFACVKDTKNSREKIHNAILKRIRNVLKEVHNIRESSVLNILRDCNQVAVICVSTNIDLPFNSTHSAFAVFNEETISNYFWCFYFIKLERKHDNDWKSIYDPVKHL